MEKEIPIISFQEIQQGSEKVREACKVWGCFRLTDHGVSGELMAEMKSTTKALFDRRNGTNQVNYGKLANLAENSLFESMGLNSIASSQSMSSFCSNLLPQQREIIEKYTEALSKLASNVVSKIAANMGEPEKEVEEWPKALFRINKYNFSQDNIGCCGLEVHTDANFLTIVQDDEIVGGFEVIDPSGSFVPVHALPDSFFVNIGDIAVVWSNGELRNVQHRVQCKEPVTRFSIVTSIFPPSDKIIEPQECFLKAGEPRRYPPITNSQYRKIRDPEKLFVGQALNRICLTK